MVKAAKLTKKALDKRQNVKYNDFHDMLQSTTEHIKKEKVRVIAHIEVLQCTNAVIVNATFNRMNLRALKSISRRV